jgi:hypothetical protein
VNCDPTRRADKLTADPKRISRFESDYAAALNVKPNVRLNVRIDIEPAQRQMHLIHE